MSVFDEFFSSSDDDDDPIGQPIEAMDEILSKLQKDFPYHKNGPAQSYDWTPEHIDVMSQNIKDFAARIKSNNERKSRKIRAHDYLGVSKKNHLLKWVNSCLRGERFAHNPNITRGKKLELTDWSNHKLWEYVSETLIHEFHYWTDIHKKNLGQKDASKVLYPQVTDLIFRENDDFVGGLWSDFSKFWEPFIEEVK